MKQEEKELLLKDLCARLTYGVKILHEGWNYEWDQELSTLEKVTGIDERFIYTKVIIDNGEEYTSRRHTISLFDDKLYLFPLWRMTKKQKEEFEALYWEAREKTCNDYEFKCVYSGIKTDWFNKNHFDYRGLIKKGLAIDATGLNVY